MSVVSETLETLASARQRSSAALVSFSGGKDSLVVLDLAQRTFERVEAFFMYLVPGLEVAEEELAKATARTGVKIRQYPHWALERMIRQGVYCFNGPATDDLPLLSLKNIQDLAMYDSGIPLLLTGAKRADSLWRRRDMTTHARAEVLCPIAAWTKHDVLAYLARHGIPRPDSEGGNSGGIGLATPSLLWLHDKYPADFRRICEVFPLAEAVVWRRTWHGVTA